MPRFCSVCIPHFAAWAAVRADIGLRGQPVLIHEEGRVLAVSSMARAKFAALEVPLPVGEPTSRALQTLPGAIVVPHNTELTEASWDEVLLRLFGVSKHLESMKPGVALLPETSGEKTRELFGLLRQWLAQAGSSDDRSTAELCALTAIAGTLRTIRTLRGPSFLLGVPVETLKEVGIGADAIEWLQWFGFRSVGEMRELSLELLTEQFGDEGETIFGYAQGSDKKPVELFSPDSAFRRDTQRTKSAKQATHAARIGKGSFIVRWKSRAGFLPHNEAHDDKAARIQFP